MLSKIKNFLLFFSVIFFISGITFFTAYNWKEMSNIEKLSVPSAVVILGLAGWFLLKKDIYRKLSLFVASFSVGTLFAVFGQIYQTGADNFVLFRNWGFFLIVPSIVGCFYPLYFLTVIVFFIALFLYLDIYFLNYYSFFFSCLFIGAVVVVYPYIVKKLKIKFNNIFFYGILSVFFPLYIFSIINGIFENEPFYFYIIYISVLGIFFIEYRLTKKSLLLSFDVISTGFYIWALYLKNFENYTENWSSYFLISLIIFICTLVVLAKTAPKPENEMMPAFFNILKNFLKIIIFILCIGLILVLSYELEMKENIFIFGGIIFTTFSMFAPKILKFQKDKTEIISLTAGLSCINIFLTEIIKIEFLLALAVTVIIFDLFFYFKPARSLDVFFVPMHILFIYEFLSQYGIYMENRYYFIFEIILIIIFLSVAFDEKIKKFKENRQMMRIFLGNEILIFFKILFLIFDFNYYKPNILINFTVVFISIFIIIKEFYKKRYFKTIGILIFFIILINCFCANIYYSNVFIMLMFLYIFRKDRWNIYMAGFFLAFIVFKYYYFLDATFIEKSVSMFKSGSTLLAGYLSLKYFSEGAEKYENKIEQ